MGDPAGLAEAVTADIQAVHADRHVALRLSETRLPNYEAPTSEEEGERERQMRLHNYCFECIEILPGNIGYLRLSGIAAATPPTDRTATAARQSLANTDVLIIDLRENRGPAPE